MTTALPLVVVVEDDSQTLKAVSRLLNARGFEVAGYDSAEAFLSHPPHRPPACLVVDIQLEGMSGLDLQRRLKDTGSTVPLIVLTGTDDPRIRMESQELGCASFLTKEADGERLPSVIQSLVRTSPTDGDCTKGQ